MAAGSGDPAAGTTVAPVEDCRPGRTSRRIIPASLAPWVETPRVLRFCPPEIGVLVAKQKHDSGRKKLDQRRSKEKREPGGRRGDRAPLGKGGGRGKAVAG